MAKRMFWQTSYARKRRSSGRRWGKRKSGGLEGIWGQTKTGGDKYSFGDGLKSILRKFF